MVGSSLAVFLLGSITLLATAPAYAVELLSVALSKDAYNLGEPLQFRITLKNDQGSTIRGISGQAQVRIAGGPTVAQVPWGKDLSVAPGATLESGYQQLWDIPPTAFLGLYEVNLNLNGSLTPIPTSKKFVVYRQDVAIELLETERKQYVAGDVVRVRAVIRNLGKSSLSNLKLVLGRGYPWISGFGRGSSISGAPPELAYTYPKPVNLQPGQMLATEWFDTMKAAVPESDQPDIFNMFGWMSDASQRELFDLELTNTFVVRPWNYQGPLPYHTYQHLYKFLRETDYRGISYQQLDQYEDDLPVDTPKLGPWMGFSPHNDDELAYLPLVPQSRTQNVPFHLVQMTAGDGNVESVHRYGDGVSNAPDWHTLGYVRYYETVHASEIFGVKAGKDASHLGLPDGGLLPIFEDTSGKNFFMFTTGTDHTPYIFAYKKNLAYNREEILKTLIELIKRNMPQDIYTPHPDEGHADHRTTTFFVLEALKRMRKESGYEPRVHVYVAYGAGDFPKARYTYEPETFQYSDRTLLKLHFASWAYQSQFSVGERGGIRLPLSELRKNSQTRWYRLTGW